MTISTYAGLLAKLTDTNDFTIASADAADLITLAEARINKEVRHRHMEKALSGTMAAGVLALPSDYVELKHARVNGYKPFARKTAEWIYANYPDRSATARPSYIARDGANFIFGPASDANYAIVGIYYYRFGALSAGLNSLFTDHPDLYLFAAYAESEPFIGRDSRIAIWEAKYEKIKNALRIEERDERFSGGPLTVTVA